tara:strand:+ start:6160 stop:6819 length:660 start_codon:yes stop_codon:yes gene_type:complete
MIDYFNHIYVICLPERMWKFRRLRVGLQRFYPEAEPQFFEAVDSRMHNNHFAGHTLASRRVIEHAKKHGYERILVFEEDAIFHKYFNYYLDNAIAELKTVEWDMVKLGGHNWEFEFPKVEGCQFLEIDNQSTCTHSIGINQSLYDIILDEIPDNLEDVLEGKYVIDQWYLNMFGRNLHPDRHYYHYITSPRICTQDPLLGEEDSGKPDNRQDFYIPDTK